MHRRVIPLASLGNTVPTATFAGVHRTPLLAKTPLFDIVPKAASTSSAPSQGDSFNIHRSKKPPLPKGGVGGDSVSPSRQHRVDGNVCGLANALLFDIVLKATSEPPPPLRGTSLERGRFIWGDS